MSTRTAPPPAPRRLSGKDKPANAKQAALETIKKWVGAKTATFETLLGSPEAAKRFGQVLILACLRNPALLTCDLKSLFLAALYCAQRGLEPGVQDGCALVPYKGKVTPIPQYRALVKQAVETGSVKSAKAILIHANDQVEWEEGMNPRFIHRPAPFGTDRGPVIGAYSRIVLPDGTVEIEPMTLDQIYKRRNSSTAWRDSHNRDATPWGQWENEMIKKTALKNGLRTIPVSPRLRDLLESDNKLEGGAPVEAVLDNDVLDATVAEVKEPQPQTKADVLADMLMGETPAPPPAPDPEQPPIEPPEETENVPDELERVPEEPAPESPSLPLTDRIIAVRDLAIQKNLSALVLEQFKMNSWEDFQAFPELIPTLEQFVEQARPLPPEKPKKK